MNAIVVPPQQGLERITLAAHGALDQTAAGSTVTGGAPASGRGPGNSVVARVSPSSIDALSLPFKGSSCRSRPIAACL